MNDIIKTILKKIDNMRDEIVIFHQKIIQIPSENPPGKYEEISKFVENKMNEIGLATKVKKNNVVGEIGIENGPSLILYGHMDTVEASKGWTKDPFGGEIMGSKIYGRGACDDKAGVTAEIFATKAILESGLNLNGKLILLSVVDEESGGLKGVGYLLNRNLVKGDFCLLGDGYSDYPAAYYGGCIFMSFQITRKQMQEQNSLEGCKLHIEPSKLNTIQKMVEILNFLTQLQEDFKKKETKYPLFPGCPVKYSSINLTKIQGGENIGRLPNSCLLHCFIYLIPEQDVKSIKAKVLNFVEELKSGEPNLDINVQIPFSYEPYIADPDSKFIKIVKKSTEIVFGEEREFKYFRPINDAHYFVEKGIDTITFGSACAESNFHGPDEYVKVRDLLNTTKLFATVILNYLF